MLSEKVRLETPDPCPPKAMVGALLRLVKPLTGYDHIAIGFPGVVRAGRVVTAPHWDTRAWANFALAASLSQRLGGVPARLINDAEMQGLAVIHGKGLELVLTLGTGAGTALFRHGEIMPHLELAHHPLHKSATYNDYIGNAALKKDRQEAVEQACGAHHRGARVAAALRPPVHRRWQRGEGDAATAG